MGNPRCIVSGCPNDAVQGFNYCKKHGGKVPKPVGKPPKYSEFVSDLLESGCKHEKVNAIIKELDLIGASLEEIKVLASSCKREIKLKQIEFYDAKLQGFDDADAGYKLGNEIRNLQGKLKKLNKLIKHKQEERNREKYAIIDPYAEENERENAVLKSDEDINDGSWHDVPE